MSGNNENGGGCGRACSGCLDYIRSIPRSIRNFSFRRCSSAFLVQTDDHLVRTVIILISTVLATVSLVEYKEISWTVPMYCGALLICSFLTFIWPKGRFISECHQERRQRNLCRQDGQGARQSALQQPEGAEQPPAGALGNAVEQIQELISAAPEYRHVQEAPFDFHHAEEPSESSNSVEPASTSSDEPLQQAAPSDSGSKLPRSSTDPSTQSTPLDVTNEEPRNNEPLQQAAPSDSGSNLP